MEKGSTFLHDHGNVFAEKSEDPHQKPRLQPPVEIPAKAEPDPQSPRKQKR